MKRKIILCALVTLLFGGLFAGGFLGYLRQKEGYTPMPEAEVWELGGLFTGEHEKPDPATLWPTTRDWPGLVVDNGDRIVILTPRFAYGGWGFWSFPSESVEEMIGGGIGDLKPGRWCRMEIEFTAEALQRLGWGIAVVGPSTPDALDRYGAIRRVEVLETVSKAERDKAVAIYHQSCPTYRNTSRWTWLRRYCAVAVPTLGLLWAGSLWLILRRKKRGERK